MTDRCVHDGRDDLRLIVDAAENGMLVIDEHGTIELANSAAEAVFGYAPGALHGHPVDILDSAEIRASVEGLFDPAEYVDPLGVSAAGIARTARTAAGVTIPLAISARRLASSGGNRVLITLDQTASALPERVPSVPPRRQSPSPASIASADVPADESQTPSGRWRYDLRSHELTWSDEIFRIYGRSPLEPPTVESAVAGYHEGDRARIGALVDQAVRDGTPYRDEARIVRPDGSVRSVVHGGSVERSADGEIVALVGFFQDVTEHANAVRERQRLNDYVMLANQAGKIGIWELDLRTNVSVWDPNMYALYGIDDTSRVPTHALWLERLHPHDRGWAAKQVKSDIAGGAPSDTEFRVVWDNGEIHNIRSLVTVVGDASGVPTRIIGTDWDVTEIRMLGDALREEKEALVNSESRYRALTEALPQMVWVMDAASQFEYVNARWTDYTGLALDASAAIFLADVIDPQDTALSVQRAAASTREFECETRFRRADGIFRWHLVRCVPFNDATGRAGKWIVTATDIEERKTAERTLAATMAELEHIAHHDPMTDLPNRMLLMDRVEDAIAQAQRVQGGVIVLYIDLDRFKAINDSLGHAAGDEVLKKTGRRIMSVLRDGDTASRVGGDEFVVVCGTSRPNDDGSHLAARILAAVTDPIAVAGERVCVEASIGISVYPADGGDPDTLIRCADTAMYAAKDSGRNTIRRFSTEAHSHALAAASFEAELRHALSAGQLVVHYQPIIDLRTMRPRAAEALVRWQHPQRGLLPPGEFIAFAEERGLIAQIGALVTEQTCAMLDRLRDSPAAELRVGVNVSAHEFGRDGFIAGIVALLDRYALDPGRLTVEITESVMMGNSRITMATLNELRALGVSLSVDDFGTGYSSLAYIKKFPISVLKIDRSFVRDIADDKTDQAIAKTIITLAHSLGMRVCAEGVETQAQLERLESYDVDSVQGYLFSHPLPPAEFESYLGAWFAKPPLDQTDIVGRSIDRV